MKGIELAAVQERFADIVWANEPISSGDLVKVCEKELSWKKPTTYTVLRKLCEKGLLQNVDGIVSSRISKEEFYSAKSEQIIEDSYEGSLPAFIAAFTSHKKLSKKALNRTMWRHANTLEWANNYERMQASGFAYAMLPVIEELYDTDEERSENLKRHLRFYNTHPSTSAAISCDSVSVTYSARWRCSRVMS